MKPKTILICVLLTIASTNALAKDRFGLGVIVGEPTGLSLKYWLDRETAIDGAVAWSFSGDDSLQLHADYLWHNDDLIDSQEFAGELPVSCGVGVRFKFDQDPHDDTLFGIRLPLGISYLFDRAPFDVFAEIVPILDLSPDFEVELNAAVGLRFYFE